MGVLLTRRAALTAGFALSVVSTVPFPTFLVPAASAQAVIRGQLYDDATGSPVRATVMLVDPGNNAAVVHVVSDALGQFLLQAQGGTYQLAAVRDGYTSVLSSPIPLVNGERLTVRMPIARDGDPKHHIGVLEHVRPEHGNPNVVADLQRGPKMEGYESRRASGNSLQYDRAALERSNAQTLGEFLEGVPGFDVTDPGSTSSMLMSRDAAMTSLNAAVPASCQLGWFVDGHRMNLPGQVNDPVTEGLGTMELATIEAVEIFRGISEMPPEFAQPDLRCGAVAIWTRRG